MTIKIINKSNNILPEYQTKNSAGMDLKAHLSEEIIIKSFNRVLVPTGIYLELPKGYEAQIRPRSGLAIKNGITVLNSPGTIDSDYRGEICVILINLSDSDFKIKNGDRICQMIISKHEKIKWIEVKQLKDTQRNIGGFGHTGK
jgi:dUTP pyrophosphatase